MSYSSAKSRRLVWISRRWNCEISCWGEVLQQVERWATERRRVGGYRFRFRFPPGFLLFFLPFFFPQPTAHSPEHKQIEMRDARCESVFVSILPIDCSLNVTNWITVRLWVSPDNMPSCKNFFGVFHRKISQRIRCNSVNVTCICTRGNGILMLTFKCAQKQFNIWTAIAFRSCLPPVRGVTGGRSMGRRLLVECCEGWERWNGRLASRKWGPPSDMYIRNFWKAVLLPSYFLLQRGCPFKIQIRQ